MYSLLFFLTKRRYSVSKNNIYNTLWLKSTLHSAKQTVVIYLLWMQLTMNQFLNYNVTSSTTFINVFVIDPSTFSFIFHQVFKYHVINHLFLMSFDDTINNTKRQVGIFFGFRTMP